MSEAIRRFFGNPVIPVVVIDDAAQAVPLAETLLDAGISAIEITLRTPQALAAAMDQLGFPVLSPASRARPQTPRRGVEHGREGLREQCAASLGDVRIKEGLREQCAASFGAETITPRLVPRNREHDHTTHQMWVPLNSIEDYVVSLRHVCLQGNATFVWPSPKLTFQVCFQISLHLLPPGCATTLETGRRVRSDQSRSS